MDLWQNLSKILGNRVFTEEKEEGKLESVKSVREKIGSFIPNFLKGDVKKINPHQLQIQLSQGLTRLQALQTLTCIALEADAHPRDSNSSYH